MNASGAPRFRRLHPPKRTDQRDAQRCLDRTRPRARDPWQELADDMFTGQPVTRDHASPEAWELFEEYLSEQADGEYDPDATPESRYDRDRP